MLTSTRTLAGCFLLLLVGLPILAQTSPPIDTPPIPKPPQTQSPIIITATTNSHRVRWVALGEVNYTRVQVFAADGTAVYDSDFKLGNLVDWSLRDQQGQTLTDGSYLFLLTVKDFAGNLTQKYGTAQLEQGQVSLQQVGREELPSNQAAALTANQLATTLSPVDRVGATASTSVLPTESDSTTPGDRVSTTQKAASKQTTTVSTNLTTQGAIAKFADSSGNLTNSIITESNNQVLVAGNQLITPLGATPTYEVLAGSDPTSTVMLTTNGSNFGWQIAPTNASNDTIIQVLGQTFSVPANRGEFGIYLGADSNSAFKVIQRGGSELFRVNRAGNVGIGNPSPQAKLDVAGTINTSTQYNIGGQAVLSVSGTGNFVNSNTFAGVGAGTHNTPDTSGNGSSNSFYGNSAGNSNTTGSSNSFFGFSAGFGNTGSSNSFFGSSAGNQNTTGARNTFVGEKAGFSNTTGNSITVIGQNANVGANNLDHSTVIGADAIVNSSNTVVLGRSADTVQIPGALSVTGATTLAGSLSADTLNASTQFNLGGSRILSAGSNNLFAGVGAGANNTGSLNAFFGFNAGNANAAGVRNSFFGALAGLSNTTGGENSFFGVEAGKLNTSGAFNSFFGDGAGVSNTTANDNSFFGYNAGLLNTTEHDNTFIGYLAGRNNGNNDTNNNANFNTFVGSQAGLNNTIGSSNSFFGFLAGASANGSVNSFYGYEAGQNTTNCCNNFFGSQTGQANTTGTLNSFFGGAAGSNNTQGSSNAFFGDRAGNNNTTGSNNSYYGINAGFSNTTTDGNSFFGFQAGYHNTLCCNSFFGTSAGFNNTSGTGNSFFGFSTGNSNTTGSSNSFFGRNAGLSNTTGHDNTFIGDRAGQNNGLDDTNNVANFNTFVGSTAGQGNGTGSSNSFFGASAGKSNTTGVSNSFFGASAGASNLNGSDNAFFGLNAGNKNTSGSSNSYFGVNAGLNNSQGVFNSFFGTNAGSSASGSFNSFFGTSAGLNNGIGNSNTFIGVNAGKNNTTASNNTFIGLGADFDSANPTGDSNTLLGTSAQVVSGISNATAIGYQAQVAQSNSIVLGSISGVNNSTANTNVGIGTNVPNGGLEVKRNWDSMYGALTVSGDRPTIRFSGGTLAANQQWILHLGSAAGQSPQVPAGSLGFYNGGTSGSFFSAPALALTPSNTVVITNLSVSNGTTALCRNSSNEIANCNSSSLRYKSNVKPFALGLEVINRLHPISFNWKQDGTLDIGFGAEEVESVEPLFTFRNAKGETEGVRYDRLSVLFVNAFKQQQAELTRQRDENARQQQRLAEQQRELQRQKEEIDSLKILVCLDHPQAEICR